MRRVIIMEGGQYMGRGMSSLEVELTALDDAMPHLATHL